MARAEVPVRPIAHLSLVDRVTDELHRTILDGDITPGAVVSIIELCEQFGVSHIPVREDLRRLESEGLVSLRPGRSALVASLSPEDLAAVYRLRKVVEGDLALRAMATMSEERLAQAQTALDQYVEIEREPAALAAAHHAFHAAILADVTGAIERRVLDLARAGKAEELRDAWVHHLESSETAIMAALAQATSPK